MRVGRLDDELIAERMRRRGLDWRGLETRLMKMYSRSIICAVGVEDAARESE